MEHEVMEQERRQHRRLEIRLPLEYYPVEAGPRHTLRTVTQNISTGGIYFEVDLVEGVETPDIQRDLNIELTVPPGDGYFPYEGRLTSVAEVVRCDVLEAACEETRTPARVGVAARVKDPLTLAF